MSNHRHGLHLRGLYACLKMVSGSPTTCKYCGARVEQPHSVDCATQLPKLIDLSHTISNHSLSELREFWDLGWNAEEAEHFSTATAGVAYCMGRDCRMRLVESDQLLQAPSNVGDPLPA